MQDRYTGDIGDYGKYGLLRVVAGHGGDPRLGLAWYLVPDEDNGDGRFIGYLDEGRYASCDPFAHRVLREIVSTGARSVDSIEKSHILPAYDRGSVHTHVRRKHARGFSRTRACRFW